MHTAAQDRNRWKAHVEALCAILAPEVVPGVHEKIRRRQARQQKYYNRGARDLDHLKDGDPVVMQPRALNDHTWRKGHVTRKVGIRTHEVEAYGYTFVTGDTQEKCPLLRN